LNFNLNQTHVVGAVSVYLFSEQNRTNLLLEIGKGRL